MSTESWGGWLTPFINNGKLSIYAPFNTDTFVSNINVCKLPCRKGSSWDDGWSPCKKSCYSSGRWEERCVGEGSQQICSKYYKITSWYCPDC